MGTIPGIPENSDRFVQAKSYASVLLALVSVLTRYQIERSMLSMHDAPLDFKGNLPTGLALRILTKVL